MKILLVEDESSIAENISYALSSEGFEPVWEETGSDALVRLDSDDIGFVIIDIGLPDMSGFDVVRKIRKNSTLPVLLLTARTSEIDKIVGLELGADDYMIKPFSPRELTARVRAILRRMSHSSTVSQSSGPISMESKNPFRVDEEHFTIFFEGCKLDLSRYEYRLMKALVENPGRVFSREQLMNKAWENPDMSLERTIDTHIKTIRRKLKNIRPDCEAIITHRGFGYSLDAQRL